MGDLLAIAILGVLAWKFWGTTTAATTTTPPAGTSTTGGPTTPAGTGTTTTTAPATTPGATQTTVAPLHSIEETIDATFAALGGDVSDLDPATIEASLRTWAAPGSGLRIGWGR